MTGSDKNTIGRDERKTGYRTSMMSLLAVFLLLMVLNGPAAAASGLDSAGLNEGLIEVSGESLEALQAGPLNDFQANAVLEEIREMYDLSNDWGADPFTVPTGGEVGMELSDAVHWITSHPGETRTGSPISNTGLMGNRLDVPILVTLDYSVDSIHMSQSLGDTACSFTGFVTDSASPELWHNTYLLLPEGDSLMVEVGEDHNGDALVGVGFDDSLTFRLEGIANAPGTCSTTIQAAVGGIGLLAVGEQTMEDEVEAALDTSVDLGTVTFDCATQEIVKAYEGNPDPVQAGEVDFQIKAVWALECGGDRADWHGEVWASGDRDFSSCFEDADECLAAGSDEMYLGANVGKGTSIDTATDTRTLYDGDSYTVDVDIALIKATGWDIFKCLAAIGVGIAGLLFGPIVAIIFAAISLALAIECLPSNKAITDSYSVTVEAQSGDELLRGRIDEIIDNVPSPPCSTDCLEYLGLEDEIARLCEPEDCIEDYTGLLRETLIDSPPDGDEDSNNPDSHAVATLIAGVPNDVGDQGDPDLHGVADGAGGIIDAPLNQVEGWLDTLSNSLPT